MEIKRQEMETILLAAIRCRRLDLEAIGKKVELDHHFQNWWELLKVVENGEVVTINK